MLYSSNGYRTVVGNELSRTLPSQKKGHNSTQCLFGKPSQSAVPSKSLVLAHGKRKISTPNTGTKMAKSIISPDLIAHEAYGGGRQNQPNNYHEGRPMYISRVSPGETMNDEKDGCERRERRKRRPRSVG